MNVAFEIFSLGKVFDKHAISSPELYLDELFSSLKLGMLIDDVVRPRLLSIKLNYEQKRKQKPLNLD